MTLLFMFILLAFKWTLVRKKSALVLFFYCFVFSNMSLAFAQEHSQLKAPIIVKGDVVQLDDIFTYVPFGGNEPVLRAPPLGTKGSISALKLQSIAKKYRINWKNDKGIKRIMISRPAFLISQERIIQALKARANLRTPLRQEEEYKVILSKKNQPFKASIALKNIPLIIEFSRFPVRGTGAFTARAYLDSEPKQWVANGIKGRLEPQSQQIVTTRALKAGAIITALDIKKELRPLFNRTNGPNLQKEDVVGKLAKRELTSGSVLTNGDLRVHNLVVKNGPVTILYNMNGLRLSMEGRALSDGALGKLILVENLKSKRQFHATIIDKELAQIRPAPKAPSQAKTTQQMMQTDLFTSSIEKTLKQETKQ